MFSHVMLGVNDLEVSKIFYDALFATLSIKPGIANNNGVGKLSLAYLRDPDGNELCALHRPPKV